MNTPRINSSASGQQGAVLLAVLVTSLVLVLLVSTAQQIMTSRIELTEEAKLSLQRTAAIDAKMNELIYLASTQRITPAGIGQGTIEEGSILIEGDWLLPVIGDEIRVDGYQYTKTLDNVELNYSVQGESGLVPVNTKETFWLELVLQNLGVEKSVVTTYTDSLADYADGDDLRRPMGAESEMYIEQDLKPPSNFLLQSCTELSKVMSWAQLIENNPFLTSNCSLQRNGTMNVNAIPEALLKLLWNDNAETIYANRANGKWITRQDDLFLQIPSLILTNDYYYSFNKNESFSLNVTSMDTERTLQVRVGMADNAPYRIYVH